MPKSCHCVHRLTFRRLPLGAFGKQDQDYDDVFNSTGYTLARLHFGLENGVHLSAHGLGIPGAKVLENRYEARRMIKVEVAEHNVRHTREINAERLGVSEYGIRMPPCVE